MAVFILLPPFFKKAYNKKDRMSVSKEIIRLCHIKVQVIAITLFLIFSSYLQGQTGYRDPRMSGIDNEIQQFLDYWFVPGGATVAISKDGRLVYARGFGKINNTSNKRIYPEHKFRVASVSKPITAVAIMQLMEEGLLSLDDTVFGSNGILNEYTSTSDMRINNITIYHLLHHLGGWREKPMFNSLHVASQMGTTPPPDQSVFIEYMMGKDLKADPGTSYEYSNFGYLVLGRLIEKISGKSYEDYVAENIFNPTAATSFVLAKNKPEAQDPEEAYYFSFATGESIYGDGNQLPLPYGGFDIEAMDSHGGWVCTASDLARFATSVDGYTSRPDIIAGSTRQLMITPSAYSNYAKGWSVGYNNMWHVGSLPGTVSETVCIGNKRVTFTIIVNFRFESNPNGFIEAMDKAVWDGINSVREWPEYDLFVETPAPIESEEGEVADELMPGKTEWGSVAWHGNYAWILNEKENTWYEVDKETGITGESFTNPEGALFDSRGAAWSTTNETIFTNQYDLNEGEVWEITTNGVKVNSWPTNLGNTQRGLAIRNDEIWISLPGKTIYRFDLMGNMLDDVSLDTQINSPAGIEWENNQLWIIDSTDNLIRIFDYSEETLALTGIKDIPAPYVGLRDMSFTESEMLATGMGNDIIYLLKTENSSSVNDLFAVVDMAQNFPNPVINSTSISYFVLKPDVVNLAIYNIQGQKIADLVNEFKAAGKYSVIWDCNDGNGNKAEPGIYFYKIKSDLYTVTKKMILIR
ncbi:MAG: serine hydrolase [Bacteroidota bacterium]